LHDQVSWLEENEGSLTAVFKDGNLVKDLKFSDIKQRLARYV